MNDTADQVNPLVSSTAILESIVAKHPLFLEQRAHFAEEFAKLEFSKVFIAGSVKLGSFKGSKRVFKFQVGFEPSTSEDVYTKHNLYQIYCDEFIPRIVKDAVPGLLTERQALFEEVREELRTVCINHGYQVSEIHGYLVNGRFSFEEEYVELLISDELLERFSKAMNDCKKFAFENADALKAKVIKNGDAAVIRGLTKRLRNLFGQCLSEKMTPGDITKILDEEVIKQIHSL